MTDHQVVSRQQWQAAREELLKREKEHTRRADELARQRRELPWVAVEKQYRFGTDEGPPTLAELFGGRSQLMFYHFMFGPGYEAGCPVNSSMADGMDGLVPHLHARDVTLLLVSQAPLARLQAYKQRMGWSIPWVSSADESSSWITGTTLPETGGRSTRVGLSGAGVSRSSLEGTGAERAVMSLLSNMPLAMSVMASGLRACQRTTPSGREVTTPRSFSTAR